MNKTCPDCSIEKTRDEFNKNRSRSDGLQGVCRECQAARSKDRDPNKLKANCKRYREKEGYGVYIATYPDGQYIGSGQLSSRKRDHLNAGALTVKTVLVCEKPDCRKYEQLMLEAYQDQCLNIRRAQA